MKIFFARTFAIALVLILSATGLWATGSEEEPAAAADKKVCDRPHHRQGIHRAEYGGTLTYAWSGRVSENVDPWAVGYEAGWLIAGC